jgi:hypothetical protein
LLINYKDKLSKKDLLNLYNYFKTDEMILRYIFATQIQSEFLIKEKNELKQYSEKFQIKNLEFRKLKLSVPSFPLDLIKMRLNVAKFGTILAIVLYLGIVFTVNFFINLITPNDYVNQSNSAIITWILICALIASVLISYIVLKIFHPRLMKRWNKFKEFVESE